MILTIFKVNQLLLALKKLVVWVARKTSKYIANFSGSQIDDTFLGQTFSQGLSNPDINTKSGEIVYVDNRSSVSRQSQQREDIKIIIEF